MNFFNKKQSDKIGRDSISFYNFIPPPRNPLFPKLETLIKQAEVHFEAGDKEMASDVLNLMWRAIDKAKFKKEYVFDKEEELTEDQRNEIINNHEVK